MQLDGAEISPDGDVMYAATKPLEAATVPAAYTAPLESVVAVNVPMTVGLWSWPFTQAVPERTLTV